MAFVGGEYHTITLSDDGTLHSFGRNSEGQLGLGNNNDTPKVLKIKFINFNQEKKKSKKIFFPKPSNLNFYLEKLSKKFKRIKKH